MLILTEGIGGKMGTNFNARVFGDGEIYLSMTTLKMMLYKDLTELAENISAEEYIKDFLERIKTMKITRKDW